MSGSSNSDPLSERSTTAVAAAEGGSSTGGGGGGGGGWRNSWSYNYWGSGDWSWGSRDRSWGSRDYWSQDQGWRNQEGLARPGARTEAEDERTYNNSPSSAAVAADTGSSWSPRQKAPPPIPPAPRQVPPVLWPPPPPATAPPKAFIPPPPPPAGPPPEDDDDSNDEEDPPSDASSVTSQIALALNYPHPLFRNLMPPPMPSRPVPRDDAPAVAGASDPAVVAGAPEPEAIPIDDAPAVAGSPEPSPRDLLLSHRGPFNLYFFRTWKARMGYTDTYKQHNAALKYFRELCTGQASVGSGAAVAAYGTEAMELQPYGMQRAQIVHEQGGPSFEFDYNDMIDWSWLEMIAQLDEESMFYVVGDGLVKCEFSARKNSYDHKTAHRNVKTSKPQPPQLRVWDFVVWRADGSGIRLHPQWKTTHIDTFQVEGHTFQVQMPRRGPGTSDGRGTFKKYKDIGNQASIRFDAQKKPQHRS